MERLKFEGIALGKASTFLDVIPLGNVRRENYYFLSNDKIDFSPLRYRKRYPTVVGVSTVDFFHVLQAVEERCSVVRRILAFDMNEAQLVHFKTVRHDLLDSTSRIDFLQRLFCITLNSDLVRFLATYRTSRSDILPGEVRGGGGIDEEKFFWRNCSFDEAAFFKKYGLTAQKLDAGLLIKTKILTGSDDYLATAICLEKGSFDKRNVFSIRYGRGFLRDDESFSGLRRLLNDTPTYAIRIDVSEGIDSLLRYLRYEPVILWTSNIFNRPFIEKFPELRDIASEINRLAAKVNGFPQMDLTCLYDLRDRSSLKVRPRSKLRTYLMNPHYKAFSAIVSLLEDGDSIEIVNTPEWISRDKGVSKLPRTDYCLAEEFLKREDIGPRKNIFLHSLLSYGVQRDEFERIFRKACALGSKVLVLEHNPRSPELRKMKLPNIPQYIDDLKTPYVRYSVSGKWLPLRNYIYAFAGRGVD